MSYHFTYQMEKDKPQTVRTETSIQQHKCVCMKQTPCKCLCHQSSPHLSPNHSYSSNNMQECNLIFKNVDHIATNQPTCDKDNDYDYYQKIRKERGSTKKKRNQPSGDEALMSHNSMMKNNNSNSNSNSNNQSHNSPNKFKAAGSHSMGCIFNQKDENKKIQLDLETFNQELLALKRKLANEKKDIPKPHGHERHHSINTTNETNSKQNHNFNTIDNRLYKESFYLAILADNDRQYPIDENDLNRDIIIEELKINLFELNKVLKLYKKQDAEKEMKIRQQEAELEELKTEIAQCKDEVGLLKKKQLKANKKHSFPSQMIKPIKCDTLSYYGYGVNTNVNRHSNNYGNKHNTYEDTESIETKYIKIGNMSNSLMNKIKLNNKKTIQTKTIKYSYSNNKKIQLSESIVYRLYDNKSILYFDIEKKQFVLYNYADYGNFEDNYSKESSFYLTYSNILYIITGNNCDMLYAYHMKGNKMIKLCALMNNHSKGTLISYRSDSEEESLICVGSSFNKKVEMYLIRKNSWRELPELNEERSNCSCVIINNSLLYVIFGFNNILNKYVELIEYMNLTEVDTMPEWKYAELNNNQMIQCDIKGSLAINYNDQKIILIGGLQGIDNSPIKHFYQLFLETENEIAIEKVERKYNDINKNKFYLFSSGFTSYEDEKKRHYNIAFDDNGVLHMFEINKMIHDVFYFE